MTSMSIRRLRRRGDTLLLLLGITFFMLIVTVLFLKVQTLYDMQYSIETRAQRSINSIVEYAMDDEWRKDGYNYMNVSDAKHIIYTFLGEDLNLTNVTSSGGECIDANGNVVYKIQFHTPTYYMGNEDHAPGAGIVMRLTVTTYFSMGDLFGIPITWSQTFESINFRTDDDMRAGADF